MAAAESPGLKIAVAAFLSLSVILAVSCYFLYSAHSASEARLASAQGELTRARLALKTLQKRHDDLRAKVASETAAPDRQKKANEPATPR